MPRLAAGHWPSIRRSPPLLEPLERARSSFARSRVVRELVIFGVALILGLIVVPLLIWVIGGRVLGPYTHGTNTHAGPLALVGDFFGGLSSGWVSYWLVALGPLVIICFARIAWGLITYNPGPGPDPAKPDRRVEPTVAKDRL